MPLDMNISTAVFTRLAMLLQYKEGISRQWVEKLVENTGFNRLFHNRLASTLTPGTNPTPQTDGANISGGIVQVWETRTAGVPTASKVDDSIDWRDRPLAFLGNVTSDNVTQKHWSGNSMDFDT